MLTENIVSTAVIINTIPPTNKPATIFGMVIITCMRYLIAYNKVQATPVIIAISNRSFTKRLHIYMDEVCVWLVLLHDLVHF